MKQTPEQNCWQPKWMSNIFVQRKTSLNNSSKFQIYFCSKLIFVYFRNVDKKYRDQIKYKEKEFTKEKDGLLQKARNYRSDVEKQNADSEEQIDKLQTTLKIFKNVSSFVFLFPKIFNIQFLYLKTYLSKCS